MISLLATFKMAESKPGPEIEGMRWEPWTSKSPSGSDQTHGVVV